MTTPMARWAVMAGPKGSGKSTHALELTERLRARGLRVAGFVQVACDLGDDQRGYDLRRLTDAASAALARPSGVERPGKELFCSWVFDQQAFRTANDWVQRDAVLADVVVVDEVSKLEASGKGHHDIIRWLLARDAPQVVVLCVRSDQLFWVVEKFALEDGLVADVEVPAEEAAKAAFVDAIVQAISSA